MYTLTDEQHSDMTNDLQTASTVLKDPSGVPGHTEEEALAKAKAAVDRQLAVLSELVLEE